MSSPERSPPQPHDHQSSLELLGVNSYTAQRLQHATAEHLHLTTRRCFIGPIPEGWLKSHRRDWYKHHLHIHYSSKAVTFTAESNVGRHRRMTGIDGPSVTATYGQSFPQPEDFEDDGEDDAGRQINEPEATADEPPAIPVPRARSNADEEADDSNESDGYVEQGDQERSTGDATSSETRKPAAITTTTASADPQTSKSGQKRNAPAKPALKRPGLDAEKRKNSHATSFVTAHEEIEPSEPLQTSSNNRDENNGASGQDSWRISVDGGPSFTDPSSTQSLLRQNSDRKNNDEGVVESQEGRSKPKDTIASPKGILQKMRSRSETQADENSKSAQTGDAQQDTDRPDSGGVQFSLPDISADKLVKQRLVQLGKRHTARKLRRSKIHDGEIIKMEKMLVRVEFTSFEVPPDFAENDSRKIETRVTDKWKEYMVVCRETDDEDMEFMLQLYKTRVIPAIDKAHVKKDSTHSIPLSRKTTHVNLYSSLDKTMVIWKHFKKGTLIYIMRPGSGANSMEWYTFLRNILGWSRPSLLQVNVPDLDVSVQIDNPFRSIEGARDLAQAADGNEDAIMRTMKEEQAAAGNIITRCMDMLERSPEWSDLVPDWAQDARIGLAWKRYDRLEWIHGASEKRMYGTIAMEKSHDLELRPKQHYPTSVSMNKSSDLTEPPPVEGFLVRLTSQKGVDKKIGKLFFKRLYFSTHNQYLLFSRPAHADPPPPPKFPMRHNSKIPSSQQIAEKIPLIYECNPFPLKQGYVQWLAFSKGRTQENLVAHDRDAEDEHERTLNLVRSCDGAFDLASVRQVRNVKLNDPTDGTLEDDGSEVDFDREVPDTVQDDGSTTNFDDERTFELVLRNGLVIRLQAFNIATKKEWVTRLRALVKYWRRRTWADSQLLKSVRATNLQALSIDEEQEAHLGQFAQKWEVTQSYASPSVHNICGLTTCRPIHIAGMLFRKTRPHAGFERCLAFLSEGKIIVFKDALRSRSGAVIASIQHDKIGILNLRDCYVYSGLLSEGDLGNAGSGSAAAVKGGLPGRRALPRLYTEDNWTSVDEDSMTCFVVWHGKRRGWFRSSEGAQDNADGRRYSRQRGESQDSEGRLLARTNSSFLGIGGSSRVRLVSRLGVTGKSIVFKARSRAERDRWVMGVGMEIERMGGGEDVRVVGEDKKT